MAELCDLSPRSAATIPRQTSSWGRGSQTGWVWRFQVDAYPRGKRHRPFHLRLLTGMSLRCKYPPNLCFLRNRWAVSSRRSCVFSPPANDPADKKIPSASLRLVDLAKHLRHFFWLKGSPAHVTPGAKRAVIAVALARAGEHGLEQADLFAARHDGVIHTQRVALFIQAGEGRAALVII